MERYLQEIDVECMELDAEARLTDWDVFALGLAERTAVGAEGTDANIVAEWE
jgi:hypothetical protein